MVIAHDNFTTSGISRIDSFGSCWCCAVWLVSIRVSWARSMSHSGGGLRHASALVRQTPNDPPPSHNRAKEFYNEHSIIDFSRTCAACKHHRAIVDWCGVATIRIKMSGQSSLAATSKSACFFSPVFLITLVNLLQAGLFFWRKIMSVLYKCNIYS